MSAVLGRERLRLLVAGIGGQGVLTVSRVVGEAALAGGVNAVLGQLHGMSQRGGSVQSSVVLGPGQTSFVGIGQADLVLGLEPMETLRALPNMSARSRVLTNSGRIVPHTLTQQGRDYPALEPMFDQMRQRAAEFIAIDGSALARDAGNARSLNCVMIGALAGLEMLPEAIGDELLLAAIKSRSPDRVLAANLRAFALGREAVRAA